MVIVEGVKGFPGDLNFSTGFLCGLRQLTPLYGPQFLRFMKQRSWVISPTFSTPGTLGLDNPKPFIVEGQAGKDQIL